MKKYISLFAIFILVFAVSVKTTKAEDPKMLSASVNANASVGGAAFRDDIQNKIKELKAEREVIKTEVKEQKEVSKQKIETLRENIKNQIEVTREEAKKKMEALKNQIKGEKDKAKAEMKQKRIEVREKALQKFDEAITRIKELEDKINSKIATFEAKGVETAEAKASIAIAETKLSEASVKIVEINALLALSTDQLTSEQKATLKTLTEETRVLLKEAHNALVEAVKSLRASVTLKLKAEASTDTN